MNVDMKRIEEMKKLEDLCKPISYFLGENYNPHTTIIITDSQIKLVVDEIGVEVKKEVSK